jgi:hypothetical protein
METTYTVTRDLIVPGYGVVSSDRYTITETPNARHRRCQSMFGKLDGYIHTGDGRTGWIYAKPTKVNGREARIRTRVVPA